MAKQEQNNQQQDSTGENFPGYPHYNKEEDIMNSRSNAKRVDVDVENLPAFHNATTPHHLNKTDQNNRASSVPSGDETTGNDLQIEMGTEADVTDEERKLLEDDMYYPTQDENNLRQARLDDTDLEGEKLNEESFGAGQTESGDGLDMDTAINEVASEATGENDEENQYWSLGGGENDNIVEGTP